MIFTRDQRLGRTIGFPREPTVRRILRWFFPSKNSLVQPSLQELQMQLFLPSRELMRVLTVLLSGVTTPSLFRTTKRLIMVGRCPRCDQGLLSDIIYISASPSMYSPLTVEQLAGWKPCLSVERAGPRYKVLMREYFVNLSHR